MTKTLHVVTYNIRKGFSRLGGGRVVVHELRNSLRAMDADVLFLQEVQGVHESRATRFSNWPSKPQYEFLADQIWPDFAYGRNSVYDGGHHGNAILSRYPIVRWDNQDVSAHRFENRGMLHCEMEIAGWSEPLHCVNVHLGLTGRGRDYQLVALRERIEVLVPPRAPLIIAGDFNDWRKQANRVLCGRLNLTEAFEISRGRPARSFPCALPLFHLDRIYLRGFRVQHTEVHRGPAWAKMSDHAALCATVVKV
ncbi:MAG TPA: endonuclease/exonuclease/phosphatase family protein [Burkholderiales bacterium]|nr:endonuclease/exonuclease/phosphatase family protein [Burkholderiales bacterium]